MTVVVDTPVPPPAPSSATDNDPNNDPSGTGGAGSSTASGDAAALDAPPLPPAPVSWDERRASAIAELMAMSGMPGIDAPADACVAMSGGDNDKWLGIVSRLTITTHEGELAVARAGLQMNEKKLSDIQAQGKEQLDTWIKKCVEAKKKANNPITRDLGRFQKFGVPLVMMATGLATGNAFMFASGALSAMQTISDEAGGPSLSVADALNMLSTNMFEMFGEEKKEAEMHSNLLVGGAVCVAAAAGNEQAAVLVAVDPKFGGMFVGGLAQEAGASERDAKIAFAVGTIAAQLIALGVMTRAGSKSGKSGKSGKGGEGGGGGGGGAGAGAGEGAGGVAGDAAGVSETASALNLAGGITGALTDAANGGASVAQGENQMDIAALKKQSEVAHAANQDTQALVKLLQAFLQQFIEMQKDSRSRYANNMERVGEMASEENRNKDEIASTMAIPIAAY